MRASLGLVLGLVGFLRAWITPTSALEGIDPVRLSLAVATGVAVVVLWGNLVGALLLKRCGLDPALISNPVLASLVDVTGIVAYFVIAKALLLP